jgi:hypothetical protein
MRLSNSLLALLTSAAISAASAEIPEPINIEPEPKKIKLEIANLNHEKKEVRDTAAKFLLNSKSIAVFYLLEKMRLSKNPKVKKTAKTLIDKIIAQAVIDLGSQKKSFRENAFRLLRSTSDYGLPAVKEAAKSKNDDKKKLALSIIAEIECHACGMG